MSCNPHPSLSIQGSYEAEARAKHVDLSRVQQKLRWIAGCFFLSLIALPAASEPKFQDPLDIAAEMRTAPEKRSLMAVVHAGERLIAVGSRGLIVFSDDKGKTWTQAKVPVQSDLLSAHFPTTDVGWAVGHDGVVLHSADGGKTWDKQLDGRMAGAAFKAFYAQLGPEGATSTHQIEANYKAGAALPFLDVWFEDNSTGYAVGSYNQIIATHDGGKTWEPWLHRIDNPQSLNLNAVKGIAGNLYIAGERGLIFRLDRARGYFTRIDTGYNGSFFGIAGIGDTLLAYGLRGTMYRSGDAGKHWEALAMPSEQTIAAGIARPDGEAFVLLNSSAQLLLIDKTGKDVRLLPEDKPMRATGIAAVGGDTYVVTGIEGLRTETPRDTTAAH